METHSIRRRKAANDSRRKGALVLMELHFGHTITYEVYMHISVNSVSVFSCGDAPLSPVWSIFLVGVFPTRIGRSRPLVC